MYVVVCVGTSSHHRGVVYYLVTPLITGVVYAVSMMITSTCQTPDQRGYIRRGEGARGEERGGTPMMSGKLRYIDQGEHKMTGDL